MPQVWKILALILTANVAGVRMSEMTFKMLQNVGKLIIFIRGQQKTTIIPSPKLPFARIHSATRYFII